MMRKYFLLFTFSLFTLLQLSAQGFKAEKITLADSNLENLYRIDEGVYRSEQPEAEDFKALERMGIKEVLNLRWLHSDDDEAEGTSLTLHRVKTSAHSIDEEELTQALRIIANRKGPIVIHCLHGSDRTGAVVAMYRIVFQNVSKEDAIKEMKEGGFGFHKIYFNIARTIQAIDVGEMREAIKK